MKKYNFRFYNFNSLKALHHSLRLFGVNCWAFYYQDSFGWFRLFGRGLKWKDTTKYELLFSERNGYNKAITIGRWRISYLPCS